MFVQRSEFNSGYRIALYKNYYYYYYYISHVLVCVCVWGGGERVCVHACVRVCVCGYVLCAGACMSVGLEMFALF